MGLHQFDEHVSCTKQMGLGPNESDSQYLSRSFFGWGLVFLLNLTGFNSMITLIRNETSESPGGVENGPKGPIGQTKESWNYILLPEQRRL